MRKNERIRYDVTTALAHAKQVEQYLAGDSNAATRESARIVVQLLEALERETRRA